MSRKINDYNPEQLTYKIGNKKVLWLEPFKKKTVFRLIQGQPPFNIKKVKKITDKGESGYKLEGPFNVPFNNKQTVKLPYMDGETQRFKFVDIGFVINEDPDNIQFGDINFEERQQYTIELDPSNFEHQRMWEYLMLCNELKDNPFRDPNTQPVIEIWNEESIADDYLKREREITNCKDLIDAFTDQEVREHAANLGKDESKSINVLKQQLMQDIQSDDLRAMFLKSSKDQYAKIIADIKECEKLGGIVFDSTENAWMWASTKSTIQSFARGTGKGYGKYIQMKDYLIENPKVYDSIVKLNASIKKDRLEEVEE